MSNVKGAENFVTHVGQCTQANNLTCMQCNPNIITALFLRHLFHRSSADLTDKFVLSKPIINRVGSDLGRVKENRCVSSLARARPDQKTWVENCDPTTHGLTRDLRLTHFLWEKAHSTTLIYRRCLSFNPQPQNQLLRVPQQFKLSVLHPLVVYWVVRLCGATSASPTWNRRHISFAYMESAPHKHPRREPHPSFLFLSRVGAASPPPASSRRSSPRRSRGACRRANLPDEPDGASLQTLATVEEGPLPPDGLRRANKRVDATHLSLSADSCVTRSRLAPRDPPLHCCGLPCSLSSN
jgi:hypothetical protein